MHGRRWRAGSLCLGGFGVALGLLMGYTLVSEGPAAATAAGGRRGEVLVPVLFLQRSEWRIFTRGVFACVDRAHGLGTVVDEDDDALVVETKAYRRPVRFAWHGVRGEGGAREVLHRAMEMGAGPPAALVGSSNTVLTAALAGQLAEESKRLGDGTPLFLIPWATTAGLTSLLPGRTFRFCADNRRQAALVVDRLRSGNAPGQGPARVVIVADPLDPYSVELGACYRREIGRAFPNAVLEPVEGDLPEHRARLLSRSTHPTGAEQRRAKAICRGAIERAPASTWVVLPLQNEPARRMLAAINGALPNHQGSGPMLTVICGDAVGQETLGEFAHQLGFPVWSMRTSHPSAAGVEEDVQETAEIVAELLLAFDRPGPAPTAVDLLDALKNPDPAARPFGRPIRFDAGGERLDIDAGEVLVLRPDAAAVEAFVDGRWTLADRRRAAESGR